MKEKLLKNTDKNKVGRPKLADNLEVKKSKRLIIFCLLLSFILSFSFICQLKNVNPLQQAYLLTFEKLFGSIQNKNAFMVKERYDKENNYIMEIKPSSTISSNSSEYKYVLYKLSGSSWKKVLTKEFSNDTKSIKIKINSLQNENKTYKISLYILNGNKIDKSFAPYKWNFSDSSNQAEKHAYKVFTVKGYYSPVKLSEIKEIKIKKEVINVSTDKINSRLFTLMVPRYNYRALVKYTDEVGKEITLKEDKELTKKTVYKIPNVNKFTKVKFLVWPYNISKNDLEKIKLSNWELKTDSNGNFYVQGIYILKPEKKS